MYDNENDNSNIIYTKLDNYKFLFMGNSSVEVKDEVLEKCKHYGEGIIKEIFRKMDIGKGMEFPT